MQLISKPTAYGWDIKVTLPDGREVVLGLDYYNDRFQVIVDDPDSDDESQAYIRFDSLAKVQEIAIQRSIEVCFVDQESAWLQERDGK